MPCCFLLIHDFFWNDNGLIFFNMQMCKYHGWREVFLYDIYLCFVDCDEWSTVFLFEMMLCQITIYQRNDLLSYIFQWYKNMQHNLMCVCEWEGEILFSCASQIVLGYFSHDASHFSFSLYSFPIIIWHYMTSGHARLCSWKQFRCIGLWNMARGRTFKNTVMSRPVFWFKRGPNH